MAELALQGERETITIADGQSLSPTISMQGKILVGIEADAAFDGDSIRFEGDINGDGTFVLVNKASDGTRIEWKLAASTITVPDGSDALLSGFVQMKIQALTASSPTNQTGATTVTLVFQRPGSF